MLTDEMLWITTIFYHLASTKRLHLKKSVFQKRNDLVSYSKIFVDIVFLPYIKVDGKGEYDAQNY